MIPALIVILAIAVVGPGHNEGGFQAIKEKGASAIEDGLKDGDVSTLKGNFGND